MQTTIAKPKATAIVPKGELNSSNALEFERQLTVVLFFKQTPLLVDMSNLESIDKDGLMALVSACRLAHSLKKRFSLCSVPAPIRIVLELSQLDKVFEIFESQEAFARELDVVVV